MHLKFQLLSFKVHEGHISSNGGKKGKGLDKEHALMTHGWTTVWELTVGVGVEVGWTEEGKGGKIETTLIE